MSATRRRRTSPATTSWSTAATLDPGARATASSEIRVVDYLRLPDICTLAVAYPTPTGEARSTRQPFEIGKALEVKPRRQARSSTTETLFKGQIVTLEPEFGAGRRAACSSAPTTTSHRCNRSRKSRTFQNQTSSDIVEKIVGEAGPRRAECDASGEPHEFFAAEQRDRLGLHLAAGRAHRLRVRRRRQARATSASRRATARRSSSTWPDDAAARSGRGSPPSSRSTRSRSAPRTRRPSRSIDGDAPPSPHQIARRSAIAARDGRGRRSTAASVHIADRAGRQPRPRRTRSPRRCSTSSPTRYVAAEGVAPGNPQIKAGRQGQGQRRRPASSAAPTASPTATHVLRGGGGYETHVRQLAGRTTLLGDGAARPATERAASARSSWSAS